MSEIYKLFAGNEFYPLGGYEDFRGDFSTREVAGLFIEKEFENDCYMWAHVVLNDEIVLKGKMTMELSPRDGYIKKWEWEYNDISQ